MAEPSQSPGWVQRVLLWGVWLTLLGVWTVGLLVPEPHRALGTVEVFETWRFAIAKLFHLSAYGLLAALAWRLPLGHHGRVVLIALLALHGAATELLQQFIPTRTGSLLDVAIDWTGTTLGAVASWKWSR